MTDDVFIAVCIMAFVFIVLAYVLGTALDRFRQDAVNRGFAQHNPKTGVWEWKDKAHD